MENQIMCCFDRTNMTPFCPEGPGCQRCLEKRDSLSERCASTISRGSGWGTSSNDWDSPPLTAVATATDATHGGHKPMCYNHLPVDVESEVDKQEDGWILGELERCKKHHMFESHFMKWLIRKYDLPDYHVWGGPEEPVLDLTDFIVWLVELGLGKYGDTTTCRCTPIMPAHESWTYKNFQSYFGRAKITPFFGAQ